MEHSNCMEQTDDSLERLTTFQHQTSKHIRQVVKVHGRHDFLQAKGVIQVSTFVALLFGDQ